MSEIAIEVDNPTNEILVEVVDAVVDVTVSDISVDVEVVGGPGPAGPTAVSSDAGNTAVLGSDSLIFVPASFDQVAADARYVNVDGDEMFGDLIVHGGIRTALNVDAGAIWVGEILDVNNQPILNVGAATSPGHAVNKEQMDAAISGIVPGIDQITADGRYVNSAGDTIPGLLAIDRGPGAGVPLLQFRTNNGQQVISSDASSYTTFSNGIIVPVLYTGGIGFNIAGAQLDMNMGTIIQATKFTTTAANGHFRNYSDYNAGQGQIDQGFIHTYQNRQSGAAPQAAFQVHKSGDVTENPFLISSNGYGWLRNLQPDKIAWTVRAASGQVAMVFAIEGPTGNKVLEVDQSGWLYFQNQSVALGASPGQLISSAPIALPGDPAGALQAATKQYVDSRIWSGTQAAYDAIPTKDPTVLYVVI